MKGYLLKFYLEENENYKGKPLYDWLLEVAKTIGLKGETVNNGIQSFDRQGKLHSAHFLNLPTVQYKLNLSWILSRNSLCWPHFPRKTFQSFIAKPQLNLAV